ncbi:tRNA (cytosine-5-)-methyltransferase ncl1 [Rhodotorula kratochvilovae]
MGRPQRRSNKPKQERTQATERTGSWKPIDQTNETFENYYKAQGIIPEAEWETFTKSLREPLPTTFRLTSSRSTAHALNDHIKKVYVPFLSDVEYEGAKLAPPKPISWYPNQLAWQLAVPKGVLRKDPHFKKFQHFLVYETDAGNLSRQEAVSMIPPLLLDVQPGMTALDMCAAPGSKSVQILEALHAPGASTDPAKQGLLIANDSDAKRCHLLVHQSLHRVPGTGMMVTNHDATQLPTLRLLKDEASAAGKLKFTIEDEQRVGKMAKDRVAKQYDGMLFDRILADVPCSGDGTMRKNLGIWSDWTVGNGIGLHTLQLRILLRGIQLLKPGGRLVYSTCSMNPMENESVISAALSLCPEMSILPVTDQLPELVRRPGMTTWRVLDNALRDAPHPSSAAAAAEDAPAPPSADEAVAVEQDNDKGREGVRKGDKGKGKGKKEKKVDAQGRRVWTETLWPKGDEKEKGLEHALRLYPHLQDTGAFFVCVLVKKAAPAPAAEEEVVKEDVEVKDAAPAAQVEKRERAPTPTPAEGEPEAKKARQDEAAPAAVVEKKDVPGKKEPVLGGGKPFNEEPYIYLPGLEDDQIRLVKDFFDLSDAFPFKELLVRNATGQPLRSIYLTSPLTRKLLLSNAYTRMRLISCGVKLFTRQDSSQTYACKWRLNAEGLEVVRPFLGEKRIVAVSPETLRQVMGDVSVKFEDLKEEGLADRLKALEPGSAILRVKDAKGQDTEKEEDLYLAFWVSKTSCNLMVEKLEKSALSLRLYSEDVTPHAKGKGEADAEVTPAAAMEAVEVEDAEKVEAVEAVAAEEVGEAAA